MTIRISVKNLDNKDKLGIFVKAHKVVKSTNEDIVVQSPAPILSGDEVHFWLKAGEELRVYEVKSPLVPYYHIRDPKKEKC